MLLQLPSFAHSAGAIFVTSSCPQNPVPHCGTSLPAADRQHANNFVGRTGERRAHDFFRICFRDDRVVFNAFETLHGASHGNGLSTRRDFPARCARAAADGLESGMNPAFFKALRNEEMEVAPFHGDRKDRNFIGFDARAFEIRSATERKKDSSHAPGFCAPYAIARRLKLATRPMLLMGTLTNLGIRRRRGRRTNELNYQRHARLEKKLYAIFMNI